MTRVDLITGFLGAGKTTFIRRWLRHLEGQKVLIIENEFGSVGVDTRFLQGEGCPVEDLSGVCMCCKGRGAFIGMLRDAAAHGYDRVLVEPSGIYDVDEFFNAMNEVGDCCAVGSVLAIVDARPPEALSEESEYLMLTQLLAAGMVLVSKLAPGESGEAAVAWMNGLIRAHGGERVLDGDVCARSWDDLTDEDFRRFDDCGYRQERHERRAMNHGEVYSSYLTADRCRDEAHLIERLGLLMTDARYGKVIRAKGYVRDLAGNWYEVNCTRNERSVRPVENVRRGVLVVIGQELDETMLAQVFVG